MKYFLDREGVVGLTEDGLNPEFVVLECEEGSTLNLKKLDDLIYLVRFNKDTHAKLIIFRLIGMRAPRQIVLNNVIDCQNTKLLVKSVFHALLNFNSPNLSCKNRNIGITVIRSLLPDVVRGIILGTENQVSFYLNKNTLSIYKGNECKARFPYTSFTRNFKDRISCSTY